MPRRRLLVIGDLFRFLTQGLTAAVVPARLRKDSNAMQSLVAAVSTVAGPGLGALITALSSPGGALAADAISFLLSAVLLSRLRVGNESAEGGQAVARWRQRLGRHTGRHGHRRHRRGRGSGLDASAKPLAWVVWGSIWWLPVLPLLAFRAPVWSIAVAAGLMGFDTTVYWTFWGTAVIVRRSLMSMATTAGSSPGRLRTATSRPHRVSRGSRAGIMRRGRP
jgi:hypothetical protein